MSLSPWADKNRSVPSFIEKCQLLWVKGWLSFQNALLHLLVWMLYRKPGAAVKNILIFRTGSLGDNICAAPSIAAIRQQFPAAEITLLANAGTANHISVEHVLNPRLYDAIIDYLGMDKKKLLQVLKERKFDLVIQLPQRETTFMRLLRDIVFFRLVARTGWGWELSTVRHFKKTQEKFAVFLNETERLLKIVKQNGIATSPDYSYPLKLTPADEVVVDRLFQESQLAHKKIIAIVTGAQRPLNRWPINYFKEVIESFSGEYAVMLIGGKGDLDLVKTLEQLPGVVNFCGRLTPMQSAIALKRSVLTLSNDTGPMHLSYAVGTPVLGLFSSRDFAGKWYPPDDGYNLAFRTENVHCSICFSETCGNNICMQAIKPAQVIQYMTEMLTRLSKTDSYTYEH